MKFSPLATLGLVAPAFAQLVQILEPMTNDNITIGEPFLVSVYQPTYIQSVRDIGIAITLLACSVYPEGCPADPANYGDVLYSGGYNPTSPLPRGGYYTNFTVMAPSYVDPGKAILNVVFAGLVGAENEPILQTVSTDIFLQ